MPEPLRSRLTPKQIETELIDIQENQFLYYGRGQVCDEVDDPKASDGRAGRLVGNTYEWALQSYIQESADFLQKNRWRCYAVVRAKTKLGAARMGPAFSAGVYDTVNKRTVFNVVKNLEDVGDTEYQLVELGTVQLDAGQNFYFAPPNRADITAIYLDRIFFLPENLHQ